MKRKRRSRPARRTYPTDAERELIIQRRDDLLRELIEVFVATPPSEERIAINRLTRTYGAAEVRLVLDKFQKRSRRPMVGEEPGLYRAYRLAYARFGGARRFLSKPEFEDLSFEHARLFAEREFKALLRRGPGRRERELRDLVLTDEQMWDDIFPPAPPQRPPDFVAPPAGSYPGPLKELLELGWKAGEKTMTTRARKATIWRPLVPDLERMVLDEGLLAGWPADPASWAPLHALRLVGYLGAHPSAGSLLTLMDREEDWLSDLLPSVWTEMGPQAAEPLWAYLLDREHSPEQRGNVMVGLQKLAEKHPRYRPGVVQGLARLLDDAPAEDGRANAYIAYVLGELRATEALPALRRAYKAKKVDLKTMTWDDVMVRMRKA
ncbi:MAG: hypothetical protein ACE5LU_11230 [Anaerolineae bacterium]